jgi:2-isopropylmalate synthase
MSPRESDLVFDWNTVFSPPAEARIPETFDESIRDGIQSPSVVDPPVDRKKELVALMDSLSITSADLGLPGAGARAKQDVLELVQFIRDNKLKILPAAAGRTMVKDLEPIADIQQKVGVPVMAYAFVGTSPIRQYAEDWDLDRLIRTVDEALGWAQKHDVPVAFVTEDTVRSNPATLDKLFRAAIGLGARRLVLCDTVGHATPDGVTSLVHWTRALVRDTGSDVKLEWHGHNDRGLAVINTLAAFRAGVERLHGTALGVGERVGNAALDQILLNLKLMGHYPADLSNLVRYCQLAGEVLGVQTPYNYPLAGRDAFRTATGVHAAAVIKAQLKGDSWLADRVYSGVPASEFGKAQVIEIGPMSGMSNVKHWLRVHGVSDAEPTCQAVLSKAKQNDRVLTEDEVWAAVRSASA